MAVALMATFLVGAGVRAEQVQILHSESFDDGHTPGWKFYDSTLDGRDVQIDREVTHGDSEASLLGEGNATSITLVKFLLQTSVSIPVADDVFLDFAFHLEASDLANDEVMLYFEGHNAAGAEASCHIPVALNPSVNRWHRVVVPTGACGADMAGGKLDGRMYLNWYRGAHDAHRFRLDDFRVTRGAAVPPMLMHPGTFQVESDGIRVVDDRYVQRLRARARLYRSAPWRVQFSNASGAEFLHTVEGEGDEIDARWSGLDVEGTPIEAERVTVRLTLPGAATEVRTTTVSRHKGPFFEILERPHALFLSEETMQFDARTARDRVRPPADRTDVFRPATEAKIALQVARGSRAGRWIQVDSLDESRGTGAEIDIVIGDLTSESGGMLSAPNVRLRRVVVEPMEFGFAWEGHRPVTTALPVPAVAELSVEAPGYLDPGLYEGRITFGGRPVTLSVTVTDRDSPQLWWQDEKVRLMLAKPQVMPRPEMFYESLEGYRQIAQAGFNVMIPYIGLDDHELISGKAQQFDLKSIARTRAPAYAQEGFHEPFYVWPTGYKTPLMCPFSPPFWEEVINPQALALTRVSTKTDLVGMEFDFEIYGQRGPHKYSHIYCHCYCDTCWQAARDHDAGLPELEAEARHSWLVRQRRLADYKVFQDGRLRAQARALRSAIDAINPKMQFMLLVWGAGDFLQVLADAFGTAEAPVLLSTEGTYGRGRTPRPTPVALDSHRTNCWNSLRESQRLGLRHSLVVPGVMPGHQGADPAFCRANAETLARYSDGYWVFFQQVEKPSSVADNLDAFRSANGRIVGE